MVEAWGRCTVVTSGKKQSPAPMLLSCLHHEAVSLKLLRKGGQHSWQRGRCSAAREKSERKKKHQKAIHHPVSMGETGKGAGPDHERSLTAGEGDRFTEKENANTSTP